MLSSENDSVHSIKKSGTSFPRLPILKGKALGTRNDPWYLHRDCSSLQSDDTHLRRRMRLIRPNSEP